MHLRQSKEIVRLADHTETRGEFVQSFGGGVRLIARNRTHADVDNQGGNGKVEK